MTESVGTEIIMAEPRGFCAGVDRAIDIVEHALSKFGAPIYVRHEIVHNTHVVDDLRARGAIFIEDLDEYLYHVDRMMMNLNRNGCLQSLKGIIVGAMTEMKDNEIPWGRNALEIIEDNVKELNIPIIYNFPAGHIRDNRALIFGRQVSMEVNAEQSKVVFE